jgi:hypothetical protein
VAAAVDAEPTGRLLGPNESALAVVSGADVDERLAYAAVRTDEGTSTQQDEHHIVVGALDARSGDPLWTAMTELPREFASGGELSVVGADTEHVVCMLSLTGRATRTFIVDIATNEITWVRSGFVTVSSTDSAVIGMRDGADFEDFGPVQALAIDGSKPLWTRADLDVEGSIAQVAPGIV